MLAKGQDDLLAAINEVILRVVNDGTYQAAYDAAVAATGTEDFAASGFAYQIRSMVNQYSRTFHLADNEADGNISYRLFEGGTHGPEASNQYTWNGLMWFWNYPD